jgi:hypothetical protein
MALKSSHGRQTHHTQAGLLVCWEAERVLKSAGERNTHGGPGLRAAFSARLAAEKDTKTEALRFYATMAAISSNGLGCRCGGLRETACAREAAPRGGVQRLCMM